MSNFRKSFIVLSVLSIFLMSCNLVGMLSQEESRPYVSHSSSSNDDEEETNWEDEISTFENVDLDDFDVEVVEADHHVFVSAVDPDDQYLPEIWIMDEDDLNEFQIPLREIGEAGEESYSMHVIFDVDIEEVIGEMIGNTTLGKLDEFVDSETRGAFGLLLGLSEDVDEDSSVNVYKTPLDGVYLVLSEDIESSLQFEGISPKLGKPNRNGFLIGALVVLTFVVLPAVPLIAQINEMQQEIVVEDFRGLTKDDIYIMQQLAVTTAYSKTGGHGHFSEGVIGEMFVESQMKDIYLYIESAGYEYAACSSSQELDTIIAQDPLPGDVIVPLDENIKFTICDELVEETTAEEPETPDYDETWQRYEVQALNFSIDYPAEWEQISSFSENDVIYAQFGEELDAGAGLTSMITDLSQADQDDIDQFESEYGSMYDLYAWEAAIEDNFFDMDYEVISIDRFREVDGNPAVVAELFQPAMGENDPDYHNLMVLIPTGQYVYLLLFTSPEMEWIINQSLFELILRTIQIDPIAGSTTLQDFLDIQWEVFSWPMGGLDFEYPAIWENVEYPEEDEKESYTFEVAGDQDQNVGIEVMVGNLALIDDDEKEDFEEDFGDVEELSSWSTALQQNFLNADAELISFSDTEVLNGIPAVRMEWFESNYDDDQLFHFVLMMTMYHDMVYMLHMGCLESDWDEYEAVFEYIIESVRIYEPETQASHVGDQSGFIAYVTYSNDRDSLYMMNADGSHAELFYTANHIYGLSFSQDGSQLASSADRQGMNNYAGDQIYIHITYSGKEVLQLTEEYNRWVDIDWSPDGSRFLGVEFNEDSIYLIDADTADIEMIIPNDIYSGHYDYVSWSPDGDRFVYEKDGDIFIADADGSDIKELVVDGATNTMPEWSPVGDQILYATDRNDPYSGNLTLVETMEIYLINADGSSDHRITSGGWFDVMPTWSPDGKRIAFISNRASGIGYQIFITDLYGSEPVFLERISVSGEVLTDSVKAIAWGPNMIDQ